MNGAITSKPSTCVIVSKLDMDSSLSLEMVQLVQATFGKQADAGFMIAENVQKPDPQSNPIHRLDSEAFHRANDNLRVVAKVSTRPGKHRTSGSGSRKTKMDVNQVNKRESPPKRITRSKNGRVGDIECRAAASPCSEAHPEILNMKNNGDTSTGKYHGKDTKRGQKRVEFGTKQSQVAASPHRWLPEDEISLCNVLLDLVKSGKEMNPNMSRVQRSLKGSLKHDYSKSQLYEKIRRMKTKFLRIEGNSGGKNKDRLAPGMGTHEKNLYSIWKQIWTENEQPQPEMHNIGDDGTDEKNKHGDGSEAKGRSDKQPSEMDVKVPAVAIGRAAARTPRFLKGLVERNAGGIACFRFPGYGEIFTSYRRGLNDHHVRNGPLEQKWRELHRREVKAFHQRLKLLKEECNYRLELLKQEKKD